MSPVDWDLNSGSDAHCWGDPGQGTVFSLSMWHARLCPLLGSDSHFTLSGWVQTIEQMNKRRAASVAAISEGA